MNKLPRRWTRAVALVVALMVLSPTAAIAKQGPQPTTRPLLFVASFSTNTVAVYDPTDHQLVKRIGVELNGACCTYASPDGTTVYVVGGASPLVSAIDTRTLEVRNVIPIPGTIGDRGSTLPRDGKTFWVDTLPEGNISGIDTRTNKVVKTFPGVGLQFENSVDGKWLFIVDRDEGDPTKTSFHVRSTTTGEVVAKTELPHGPGISIKAAPDGRTVYLLGSAELPAPFTSFSRSWVEVIDISSISRPRLIRSIPAGALVQSADITPDGKQLWVPSGADGTVVIIDTKTNNVVRTLETGRGVCGVGFHKDTAYLLMDAFAPQIPPSYVGMMTYGCQNVVPGALLASSAGTRQRPIVDTPADMVLYDRHTYRPLRAPHLRLPGIAYYVTAVDVPLHR